jgi:hypothetical protein
MIFISSCGLSGWPLNDAPGIPAEQGKGAMLLRHGSWLYRTGGLDESNSTSASAMVTTIGESGTLGEWLHTASLSEGIKHGAAFTAGNLA